MLEIRTRRVKCVFGLHYWSNLSFSEYTLGVRYCKRKNCNGIDYKTAKESQIWNPINILIMLVKELDYT